MTHNTQLLIATERERWLRLHLEGGLTIKELSQRSGFSRDTLHRWKRNYLNYGIEGLREKSRSHHSYPNTTSQELINIIRDMRLNSPAKGARKISLRMKRRFNINIHWRTIHKILKREHLVKTKRRMIKKEKWLRRPSYVGEIIQIDVVLVKKIDGKWLYQFTAIDGYSRWRYLEVYLTQSNKESLVFLKNLINKAPFKIRGVQTDNASIFTNRYTGYRKSTDPLNPRLHVFDKLCRELNIIHYLIDPGKPQQNCYVERSHRTDREEFWNQVVFKSLPEIKQKLSNYLKWYNEEREHLGINGLTPIEMLNK